VTATRTTFRQAIAIPIVIGLAGFVLINRAAAHYQTSTGRTLYGLAGLHYSAPEWEFVYHDGGETIRRWTTIVPTWVTGAALLLSIVVGAVRHRREERPFLRRLVGVHLSVAAAFLVVAAYYDINVTGVFI
jgi:hypothetical protein